MLDLWKSQWSTVKHPVQQAERYTVAHRRHAECRHRVVSSRSTRVAQKLFGFNMLYFACSIDVIFNDQKDGSVKTVQVPLGQSLLEAAHNNDIDLEGESCTDLTSGCPST